jgi:hypothetical protein
MEKGIHNKHKTKSLLKRFLRLGYRTLIKMVPRNRVGDKFFSFINFVIQHKRFPTNLPIFNDFLYGIKTTDEILNPLRVFVSDKEFVKLYVKAVVGDQYNVPTIAVLNTIEEVKNFSFPSHCCIKPTQASGLAILRKNDEPVDVSAIEKWFAINYYDNGREANYRMLKPKVIVEPLIFEKSNVEDYKFFCFNGKARFVQVDIDRRSNHKRKFFDRKWNELDFSILYPKTTSHIPKPENFDEMLNVAETLSQKFSLLRVDLYSNGTSLYVGELTNCHENASGKFIPLSSELSASQLLFHSEQ